MSVKQTISLQFFFLVFSWEVKKKNIKDGSSEKQLVLFSLDLNVSLGFTSGNMEGPGETKLIVSLGASH